LVDLTGNDPEVCAK